ncbi:MULTISPECIES: PAAR domain-containing protein [Pseudomonas]|uniref:PAAR domain-containing protein n=1 Tax=Pseudomonas ekonensis TaxID=2842353 RepID=A0ABS6P9Z3_9PSED|nr:MULTISPECIES: PAAR domain-containing protein [Pseudomonas]MBV4457293.1 PAAR domain-containing protein [Pseudomonas ekonensis]
MSGKPAARVSDPTACPLPGHGNNPIVSGSPNVFFDGLPAARMTDKSACGSPITGGVSATVFINGLNAATLDSTGGHGNVVVGGSGTVIIGQSGGGAAFSGLLPMPVHFNDRMQVVNEITGEPMPNHPYAIQRGDGSVEHGVTNEAGFTHMVSSHLRETIKLFVE